LFYFTPPKERSANGQKTGNSFSLLINFSFVIEYKINNILKFFNKTVNLPVERRNNRVIRNAKSLGIKQLNKSTGSALRMLNITM